MSILSLALDIAVLIGLGVTIFYCLKLSKSMNNFRSHREDMKILIDNLSKNIDEALRAIDGMKAAGDSSGKYLQKIINDSRSMATELQIINETSNSLASRLEKLGEKNRMSVQGPDRGFEEPAEYAAEPETRPASKTPGEKPAFFIHDREYDDRRPGTNEPLDEDDNNGLQSQAEKELMAALRKNKKPSSRMF